MVIVDVRLGNEFATDAAAGKLPTVTWLYAPSGMSEHPLDNVTTAQQWTVDQVAAVVRGNAAAPDRCPGLGALLELQRGGFAHFTH